MSWAELLAAAEEALAAADPAADRLPISGIGWATVDRERAQHDLDALLAADPHAPALGPWTSMDRDPALGARAYARASREELSSPTLVVLEPDTEGRLAAYLVRFGEGVGVVYVGEGVPRPGRVEPGGPAWGPHIVVLDKSSP